MGRRASRDNRAGCRRVQCSDDSGDYSDGMYSDDLESSRSAPGPHRQQQAEGCSKGESPYSDEDDRRSSQSACRGGRKEFDTRKSPQRQQRADARGGKKGGSSRGKARRKRVDPMDIDEDDGDEPPRGGSWPSWAMWVPLIAGTATVGLVVIRLGGEPTATGAGGATSAS